MPEIIDQTNSIDDFIEKIYAGSELCTAHLHPDFFLGRGILTPGNHQVDELSHDLLHRMSGPLLVFDSHDSADLNDNAAGREELTAEFLASTNVAGLPLAHLELRVGAPIMLPRNIDPSQGLCNGSRMTVTRAARHCIEVRLNGGEFNSRYRLLYRCKLTSTKDLFFSLSRTQFPFDWPLQ